MKKNVFTFMVLITGLLLLLFTQQCYTLQRGTDNSKENPIPNDIADSHETEQAWDDEIMINLLEIPQRYRIAQDFYYELSLEPLPLVALPMHFPPPNNG